METFAILVSAVVLVGVAGYLLTTMIRHIQTEKRSSRLRKVWSNFGLSMVLAILFLVTWAAQAIVQWQAYANEARTHGGSPVFSEYWVDFSQATLENWQSEFLQLFSFVVLAAMLIHRGSAESKDSDERMEAALQRIEKKLDDRSYAGKGP